MPIHDDEVRATVEQVRWLVAAQCPQWAGLPVIPLPKELEGTDHVLFRIGEALVARLPKIGWAVDQADSDARWLPMLASHLPARIPVPLHVGEPGAGFPWRWTVVPESAGGGVSVHPRAVDVAQDRYGVAAVDGSVDRAGNRWR